MDGAEELFNLLMEFQRLSRRFDCGDMTPSEVKILSYIFEEPQGISVGRLSELMRIGKSAVSQAVAKLERKGLVERRIPASDRRLVLVCATERGRADFAEKRTVILAILGRVTARVGEEESRQLICLMKQYLEATRELVKDMEFAGLCGALTQGKGANR